VDGIEPPPPPPPPQATSNAHVATAKAPPMRTPSRPFISRTRP
jgi:hypothetical protein